jgi:hypothetical protein
MTTHSQTCRGLKVQLFSGKWWWGNFDGGLGIVVKKTAKNVYWTTTYLDKNKQLCVHGLVYAIPAYAAETHANHELEMWRNLVIEETCFSYRKAPEYIDRMATVLRRGFRVLSGLEK